MNAAARLVHQTTNSHWISMNLLNIRTFCSSFLILSLLLSAIGIIYATHTKRVLFSDYQRLLQECEELKTKKTQLLLERTIWATPKRIATFAEKNLEMKAPKNVMVLYR